MLVKNIGTKLKIFIDLFLPTWLSFTVCFFISLLTIGLYYFSRTVSSLTGSQNTYILNYVKVDFNQLLIKLSSYSLVNAAVPIMFWAVVGITIYFFARLMVGDTDELLLDLSKRKKFLWPNGVRPHIILDFFERVLLRLVIFVILVIYIIHVLSPFMLGRTIVPDIFGAKLQTDIANNTIATQLIFLMLETVAIFGVVILLRFLLMRSRLLSRTG